MNRSFLFSVASVSLFACGEPTSEIHQVGRYDAARIADGLAVVLAGDATLAADEAIVRCPDSQLAARVDVRVDRGTLVVGTRYEPDEGTCTVVIHASELEELGLTGYEAWVTVDARDPFGVARIEGHDIQIDLRGSAEGHIGDVIAENVAIELDGSSWLTLHTVQADVLRVEQVGSSALDLGVIDVGRWEATNKGSSQLEASGEAQRAFVDTYGTADVRALDTFASEAWITAVGSSSVSLSADIYASVEASGTADVAIGGDPSEVDADTNGSAEVEVL